MAMPTLPTGFSWKVTLEDPPRNRGDDHDEWSERRRGEQAIILLLQNGVTVKRGQVSVRGLDTEAAFNAAIEGEAAKMFSIEDYNHQQWLASDYP